MLETIAHDLRKPCTGAGYMQLVISALLALAVSSPHSLLRTWRMGGANWCNSQIVD